MPQLVPVTGSEKDSLRIALDRHRDAIVWKLDGLDDADLRRAMLPSGNTLLGLVKHLATWEYIWICRTFGAPAEPLPLDGDDADDDADVRLEPADTTASVLAFYARARAAADQVIDRTGIEDIGVTQFGFEATLRWILIHMVEETARHAGHVDVMRELIDGMTGDHQR